MSDLFVKMMSKNVMFNVKIKNLSGFELPKYSKRFDSGIDLRSTHMAHIIPGEITQIHTGLYVELPDPGYTYPFVMEMQIRPRSGLAAQHGITVVNTPGTIDNQYRNEIIVLLTKLKYMLNEEQENKFIFETDDFLINVGDRIAQAVFAPIFSSNVIHISEVDNINKTERGEGGLGSTGIK